MASCEFLMIDVGPLVRTGMAEAIIIDRCDDRSLAVGYLLYQVRDVQHHDWASRHAGDRKSGRFLFFFCRGREWRISCIVRVLEGSLTDQYHQGKKYSPLMAAYRDATWPVESPRRGP